MTPEAVQKHCRERAFYAYGTSKIFERRSQRLEGLRNAITYLGIAVPVLVGSLALSIGTSWLPYVLTPAAVLGATQLALSVWSIVAKWDLRHSYAVSALQKQSALYNAWDRLAKRTPPEMQAKVEELDAEDERQETSDLAQNITIKEKRFAMRSALYYFGLPCVICKNKPQSMKPGACDTCGNF